MATKLFKFEGQDWEASYDGFGVGAASGFEPKVDTFSFIFRCLTDPKRPGVRGHLRESDPTKVPDQELSRALSKALKESQRRN